MVSPKPLPADLRRAAEIYLTLAYTGPLPSAVRSRLDTLHSLSDEDFYLNPIFETDSANPGGRYALRLGNQRYPHMKLVMDRTPDKQGYLFRADSHDRHICPEPGSRDYAAFCELIEWNQKLTQQIESAWEAAGLTTFKSWLREDLARRKQNGTNPA